MDNYIVLYQVQGSQIDWYTEGYFGPFTSRDQCHHWMNLDQNKLINSDRFRYVIQVLSK